MAKSEVVTYESVAKAAEVLSKAAQAPTQRAIVDRLGGSNSTVGPLLRCWRESRKAADPASDVPHNIEIDVAVANVVWRAVDAARAESQADLDDQVKEIEQLPYKPACALAMKSAVAGYSDDERPSR